MANPHFDIVVHSNARGITTKVEDAAAAKSAANLANSVVASHWATQPTAAERMQSRNDLVGMCVLGSLAGLII